MTADPIKKYQASKKTVWRIYAALIACLVAFLVLFVATDNEEKFFYSLMTIGASYAFRPNDTQINAIIKRLFDIEAPVKQEGDSNE